MFMGVFKLVRVFLDKLPEMQKIGKRLEQTVRDSRIVWTKPCPYLVSRFPPCFALFSETAPFVFVCLVRRLMNTLKVDGLTRALTRQLYIADLIGFSIGFIGFLRFSWFCPLFRIKREIFLLAFLGRHPGCEVPHVCAKSNCPQKPSNYAPKLSSKLVQNLEK